VNYDCVAETNYEDDEPDQGECNCEECRYDRGEYYDRETADLLQANGFSQWAELVGTDDSLGENGVEIRSPILQGNDGFRELEAVFSILKRNNYAVDIDCGMHVHHDAPEFINDRDLTLQLIKSWYDNQKLIRNMVSSDRWDNTYCPDWRAEDVEAFFTESDRRYWGERFNLNVEALRAHGSVEIRFHEGTLDYPEAEAWIKFGQKFIDSVSGRKNPIAPMSDEELLMRRINVAERTRSKLSEKIARNKRY